MKRLIVLALLFGVSCAAQGTFPAPGPGMVPAAAPAGNTITYVVGSKTASGNDGQVSMTSGSIGTASGDVLVFACYVRADCSARTITASTTPALTVTRVGAQLNDATNECGALFYAPVTSTSYTVTCSQNGAAARMAVNAIAIRGTSAISADADCRGFDGVAGSAACGEGGLTPANITPANGSGIIACLGGAFTGGAWTQGAGYVLDATDTYGAHLTMQHKEAPGTALQVPGFVSAGGSAVAFIVCESFK